MNFGRIDSKCRNVVVSLSLARSLLVDGKCDSVRCVCMNGIERLKCKQCHRTARRHSIDFLWIMNAQRIPKNPLMHQFTYSHLKHARSLRSISVLIEHVSQYTKPNRNLAHCRAAKYAVLRFGSPSQHQWQSIYCIFIMFLLLFFAKT